MDTTIQLFVEPLFRKLLMDDLASNGYQICPYSTRGVNHDQNTFISIIQAHLWSEEKCKLVDSNYVVILGNPSCFYCWCEMVLSKVLAYVTPLDFQNTLSLSIECILEGKHYISNSMKTLLLKEPRERQEDFLNVKLSYHLTPSELEVLVLIGEGYSTDEIAKLRFRSIHTVKTQRKAVRKKLRLMHKECLSVFAGKKLNTLKTLMLVNRNAKIIDNICKNTP